MHFPDFLEDHKAFFQVDFTCFPTCFQPTSSLHATWRIVPPAFGLVGFHGEIIRDYPIDTGEVKLDRVSERTPKLQVASKPAVLRHGPWSNRSSCTVKAQQPRRIACGYIRNHAVSAIQFSTSLASSKVTVPQNSPTDSTLILQRSGTLKMRYFSLNEDRVSLLPI